MRLVANFPNRKNTAYVGTPISTFLNDMLVDFESDLYAVPTHAIDQTLKCDRCTCCEMHCCRASMDAHLPYELRALESALATSVCLLEIEARSLERQTEPALRSLMQQVFLRSFDLVDRICAIVLESSRYDSHPPWTWCAQAEICLKNESPFPCLVDCVPLSYQLFLIQAN